MGRGGEERWRGVEGGEGGGRREEGTIEGVARRVQGRGGREGGRKERGKGGEGEE